MLGSDKLISCIDNFEKINLKNNIINIGMTTILQKNYYNLRLIFITKIKLMLKIILKKIVLN